MSNTLAIATVTATLQNLLQSTFAADKTSGLTGVNIKIGQPIAPSPLTNPQVNVYLYQVFPNVAFSNDDLPSRDEQGNLRSRLRLGLNLNYMLSFFGDEQQFVPERLLSDTTLALHTNPIFTPKMIHQAVANSAYSFMKNSDLEKQIELVKFTPIAYSLEELSKLWSVFYQTTYTLSIAYQASVVLLDAEQTPACVLPVKDVHLTTFVPQAVTVNTSQALQLSNVKFAPNNQCMSANVFIKRAVNEDKIAYYTLYWGTTATDKLLQQLPIVKIPKTSSDITYVLPDATPVPTDANYLIAVTGDDSGETDYGVAISLRDNLPTVPVSGLAFSRDQDPTSSRITGNLRINRPSDETNITAYAVYWSVDGKTKLQNEAIAILPIDDQTCFSAVSSSYDVTFSSNVTYINCELTEADIPKDAAYFIVYSQNEFGEMLYGVATPFVDDHHSVPIHAASDVQFTGSVIDHSDPTQSEISGNVVISRASDERDIDDYNLYWGKLIDGQTTPVKLSTTPIMKFSKNLTSLTYTFPAHTKLPLGAMYFLVYTSNTNGEMATGINTCINPNLISVPSQKAQAVHFNNRQINSDKMSGTIDIKRAADESFITEYILYWGSSATQKLAGQKEITRLAKKDRDLNYTLNAVTLPQHASHVLVVTRNNIGEMQSGIATWLTSPPSHAANKLSLQNWITENDLLSGVITIERAHDESDLSDYVLYWGTSDLQKLDDKPIVLIAKTSRTLQYFFNKTKLPLVATCFLVFTRNHFGEMATGVCIDIPPVPELPKK